MKTQKGQALILIALAMVAMIGLVALAVDGGNAFASRRQAQSAADAAALAAAYANVKGESANAAYAAVAAANGYTNDTRTIVTMTKETVAKSDCPGGKYSEGGVDFTVDIQSTTDTWFGGIVGQNSITNKVHATARQCNAHFEPWVFGNAVVGLNDDVAFIAGGSTKWNVQGGGIFSNGDMVWNGGACGNAIAPDLTAVGGTNCNLSGGGPSNSNQSSSFVNYPGDVREKMPPNPCVSGGEGKPDPYAEYDGVKSPKMTDPLDKFKNGVFCIYDMQKFDGYSIVLTNATLYVLDQTFDISFQGKGGGTQGGFSGTPTQSGTYAGYYFILDLPADATKESACNSKTGKEKPSLVWAGNGLNDLQGTIFAPSACVDVRGNSGTYTMKSQVVGYTVISGGTSDVTVNYNSDMQAKAKIPPTIQLLK